MDTITTVVALVAVLAPAAWAYSRMLSYDGFGGTFLRPNTDLGWPRGVQEDDDFRWRWDSRDEPPIRQRVAGSRRPPVRPEVVASVTPRPILPRGDEPVAAVAQIIDDVVSSVSVTPVSRAR